MDYNSLRKKPISDSPIVKMIGESVGIFVEGKWFLNEERIHVGDSDDAEAILTEKENISNNKKRCLVNETYSVETAIKLIKLHNKKVTQNLFLLIYQKL